MSSTTPPHSQILALIMADLAVLLESRRLLPLNEKHFDKSWSTVIKMPELMNEIETKTALFRETQYYASPSGATHCNIYSPIFQKSSLNCACKASFTMKKFITLFASIFTISCVNAQINASAMAGIFVEPEFDPSVGASISATVPVTSNINVGLAIGRYTNKEAIPGLNIDASYHTSPVLAIGEYTNELTSTISTNFGLGIGILRRETLGIGVGWFCVAPRASMEYHISNDLAAVIQYQPSFVVVGDIGNLWAHFISVGMSYNVNL